MRLIIAASVLVALTFGFLLTAPHRGVVSDALADVTASGEELSDYMIRMQTHFHKLTLALDAGNKDLAAFYMTELNETTELVETRFTEYDGFQIGALVKVMLRPGLAPVSTALGSGDVAGASGAADKLAAMCNTCHVATQRPFIKVARVKSNPYAQDFK